MKGSAGAVKKLDDADWSKKVLNVTKKVGQPGLLAVHAEADDPELKRVRSNQSRAK